MRNARDKIVDLTLICVIFLLTASVGSYFSIRNGVDPHHDGLMFKAATDVAGGLIIFRDTYINYGALTTFLQALAIKIFGEYLIVLKLLTALFYALIAIFLWLIWSRFLPRWLAATSCIIWVFLAPYYNGVLLPWSAVYALFFLVLSVYFIIRNIETNGILWIFFGGISCSLVFLCRQPLGILLFGAEMIFFITAPFFEREISREKIFKSILFYSAGFALPMLFFFFYLIVNNAVKDWYLQTIKFNYLWGKENAKDYNVKWIIRALSGFHYRERVYYGVVNIWFFLPIATIFILLEIILERFFDGGVQKRKNIIYILTLASLASWPQYYPILSINHVYWAATPMIGLFSYGLLHLFKQDNIFFRKIKKSDRAIFRAPSRKIVILGTTVALAFFYYGDVSYRIIKGIESINNKNCVKISKPRALAGLYLPKSEALAYEKMSEDIDKYTREYPNKKWISVSRESMYITFVKNYKNFHPLYMYYSGWWEKIVASLYPEYHEKLKDCIAKEEPIIFSSAELPEGYVYHMSRYDINKLYSALMINILEVNKIFHIDYLASRHEMPANDGLTAYKSPANYQIKIVVSQGTGEINNICAEFTGEDNAVLGKWDAISGSPDWTADIYKNSDKLSAEKSENIKASFGEGDVFVLEIAQNTESNVMRDSIKGVIITIRYSDDYFVTLKKRLEVRFQDYLMRSPVLRREGNTQKIFKEENAR